MLIFQNLQKTDLVSLKPDIDKLGMNKLKTVPTDLDNLKSEVDKLDVDKLKIVLDDFKNLVILYINKLLKRQYMIK